MKIEIDTILDRVCVCGELSLINNNLSWYANTKNLTAIWSATINRMENQTNERDGSWRTRGARQRFESNKDTRLLTLSLYRSVCGWLKNMKKRLNFNRTPDSVVGFINWAGWNRWICCIQSMILLLLLIVSYERTGSGTLLITLLLLLDKIFKLLISLSICIIGGVYTVCVSAYVWWNECDGGAMAGCWWCWCWCWCWCCCCWSNMLLSLLNDIFPERITYTCKFTLSHSLSLSISLYLYHYYLWFSLLVAHYELQIIS